MTSQNNSVGIVFDIDGVLCHDWHLIPNADVAIRKVQQLGIPHVL